MWILSTYETEEEAFIAEAVIQTEFGLSDLCFVDPLRPWLTSFWAEMSSLDLETRAKDALRAYHREFNFPLYQKGDSIPVKRPFITRACNLLSGGELLPYTNSKLTGKEDWTPYEITHEFYKGDVYSFTISDNHLYVADGIVTHNCQAIYGFRGADEDSMPKLRQMFSMSELFLTLCFRSAREIVRNARWRAPDMAYRPDAPEGLVKHLAEWSFSDLRPGDAIICRNNAPLFKLALAMLRSGLRPELLGGEGMKNLSSALKKLGPKEMPQADALEALRKWEEEKAKKYKSKDRASDMAECLRVFIDQSPTLGEACALLERILQQSGSIYLMTGHKSKGLEYPRVFFLDRFLLKKDGQDANIRYVIETRAKEELYYVRSDGRV